MAKMERDEAVVPVASDLDALLERLLGELHRVLGRRMRGLDLSPPLVMTMRMLDEPRSLSELADLHRCDASNVTGIADRLEQRGLAERRADPHDRRVRLLALTERGREVRRSLSSGLAAELPGLAALSERERSQLARLLAKIVG
jgi:DNA-binding MarR family transcriptional regulator